MKKVTTIMLVALMSIALLAGCASVKIDAGTSDKPSATEPTTEVSTLPETSVGNGLPAGTPAASFSAYAQVKSDAVQRFTDKTQDNSDIGLSVSMGMLSVSMVDLMLIPLTVVGIEGGEAALEMMGMSGLSVTQNGNEYTLTYKSTDASTGEESVVTQTCVYDPATDSMQSTISDETGTEAMFFEYVKVGNGYVSQYYFTNGDGTYTTIKMVFNDTDLIAFGMLSNAASEPASIIGTTSLSADFVVNDESYCILQGDALTVLADGETKTY